MIPEKQINGSKYAKYNVVCHCARNMVFGQSFYSFFAMTDIKGLKI